MDAASYLTSLALMAKRDLLELMANWSSH